MSSSAEKKTGAWSEKEDLSLLLQVLHHGTSVKTENLQVSGRTDRAVAWRLGILKKQAAQEVAKVSGGGSAAAAANGFATPVAKAPNTPVNSKKNPRSATPKASSRGKSPAKKRKRVETSEEESEAYSVHDDNESAASIEHLTRTDP
ncbi:hypothetical protein N431DRAFT_489865 [Stipitochalara longipes BDJ]|nr:hypothetical protein N431DRAFT_489865 [Stipitochalara longipes BDJ]